MAEQCHVQAHDRFISVNSLRLHYREWGDPAAPPLVLLHGGCAHAHWWDVFAPTVADAYRVLAFDLRGHGDSAWSDPPAYGVDDYADDLAAVIDALALEAVDLVGHSLGGMVAAAYGGRAPQRVGSLVIVDSQVKISKAGAHYMTRLRKFPHPVYRDQDLAIRRFRLLPTQTNATPAMLAHMAAHGVRELPDGRWTLKFDRESLAHAAPQDLLPALQRLTCPILVVRGAHSTLLPHDKLAALLAAVPRAEGAEIPNAHHHVMLDNPPEFARVVRAFLDRAHAGPRTLEPSNPRTL